MDRVRQLSFVVALVVITASAAIATEPTLGVQNLINDTDGGARITVDAQTGTARFVQLPASSAFSAPTGAPVDAAMKFFSVYSGAFGIADVGSELKSTGTIRDLYGNQHAVFDQVHEGLPVFGGQLRAHFDRKGQMFAVNNTFVPDPKIDTTPGLSAEEAAGRAIREIAKQRFKSAQVLRKTGDEEASGSDENFEDLSAFSNTLMVFRSGMLQGVPGRDYLVYEVEVRDQAVTVREFVYVDAHSGRVIEQITGIHEGLDRAAYDAESMTAPGPNYPGSPFWVEGQVPFPTGTLEADNMLFASKETYDLFFNAFGRDGFDDAGATMESIFNRGNGCPNASWNGTFISFCPGLTTDDITGHEWGHAYTEYTNNLIYQWQSGALNESYSDIWGETVDLINGRQTDLPDAVRSAGGCSIYNGGVPDDSYRWLMGEDSSLGAIRDMWNPNCEGDPASVTDPLYWCTSGDNGGVHINSGVPNHAYALMVDGGTFNSVTVAALGLTKAAHIHFGAQLMLSPASNFSDHADALETSCSNLLGIDLADLLTGGSSGEVITSADCDEVALAITAVELRATPSQCGFATLLDPDAPALCEGQGSVQTIAFEDFEGGSLPAGWSASSHDVVSPGTFDNPGWDVVGSLPSGAGGSFAAFAPDLNAGDCQADNEAGAVALDSPAIVLPLGEVPHVAFDHWVATEAGWDGGNVKISVNGGAWTLVPSGAYSFNPYNDVLVGGANDNPLADEEAFTGADGGSNGGSWGQSQVDLFGLAFPGNSIRLRYDLGVDGCFGIIGWYVDSVHVYSCSDEALPICGDGQLDLGEECDDGNMADADGCSSTCQVEDGWICEDPTPGGSGSNTVADGSFEAGPLGGIWNEFSSTFGTPICDVGSCGTGTGTGPSDGDFWVWFGGIAAYEVGIVSQDVTIAATATDLTFDVEQIVCDSGDDYVALFVDGNPEWFSSGSSPLCGSLGYTQQTVDVSAYADGGVHELHFQSEIFANNGGGTNFFVDNVELNDNVPTPGSPSVCSEIVDDLACNAGIVAYDLGIPASWTVVDNEGTGVVWTDIASSLIGGNYTGADGDAASVNSDAFIFTEYDSELISNSFDLSSASEAKLDYLVNYQNIGTDILDVDVSTDGGSSWANLQSWNEDHPPGGLFTAPGEAVSLDLGAYLGESDVQVRWHYYNPSFGDWDWYAQVDNVALTCNLIPDCDGATASPDLLWPPNHKWNAIDIAVTDPDGDPVTVTIDSVFQDEAVDAKGTGNTCPDGRGVGTSVAEVRAERDGRANGRVYHIGFTADDGRGGTCSGEVLVGVPHDQGGQTVPVDDGALFDSTADTCKGGKKSSSEGDFGGVVASEPPPAPDPAPVSDPVPTGDEPVTVQPAPLPADEPAGAEPAATTVEVAEPAIPEVVEAAPSEAPIPAEAPNAEPATTVSEPELFEPEVVAVRPETAPQQSAPEISRPADSAPARESAALPSLTALPSRSLEPSETGQDRTRVIGFGFDLAADRSTLVGGFSLLAANGEGVSLVGQDVELAVTLRSSDDEEWVQAGAACSAQTEPVETAGAAELVSFTCSLSEEVSAGSEVKVELGVQVEEAEEWTKTATSAKF